VAVNALEWGQLQTGRDHTGFWWFCDPCQEWGRDERLSFVYTAAQQHRKVVHHG
jgi:hypothetical protein